MYKWSEGTACTFCLRSPREVKVGEMLPQHLCPAVSRDRICIWAYFLVCILSICCSCFHLFHPASLSFLLPPCPVAENKGCLCFYVNMLTGTKTSLKIYSSLSICTCLSVCVSPSWNPQWVLNKTASTNGERTPTALCIEATFYYIECSKQYFVRTRYNLLPHFGSFVRTNYAIYSNILITLWPQDTILSFILINLSA